MPMTYVRPDDRAVWRWLLRLRLAGSPLSTEANELLAGRLAGRRQALAWCAPGALGVVAFAGTGLHRLVTTLHAHGAAHAAWVKLPWLIAEVVLTVTVACYLEFGRRADQKIGSRLSRRTARPIASSLPTVLGWPTVAATRATIAVDSVTVAVDDRLRSSDANRACFPLGLASAAFVVLEDTNATGVLALLGIVAPLAIGWLLDKGKPASRWRAPAGPDRPMLIRTRGPRP